MITVTFDEMANNLAVWLDRVQAGETLIVTRKNQPIVEIKPVEAAKSKKSEPRPFGLATGEFTVPENFGAPLPDDIYRQFEGE